MSTVHTTFSNHADKGGITMADPDSLDCRDDIIEGNWYTREVFIGGGWLDPGESLAVKSHSPAGFAWGYGGSGPSQLSLAILLRVTDRETATANYQAFKWDVIAPLPDADFSLRLDVVRAWLASHVGTDSRWHVRRCTRERPPREQQAQRSGTSEEETPPNERTLSLPSFDRDPDEPNWVYVDLPGDSRTAYWCPLGGGQIYRGGPYGTPCIKRSADGFTPIVVEHESELLGTVQAAIESWFRGSEICETTESST